MEAPDSVGGLLRRTREALRAAGVETPDLDARLLVAETLGLDGAGLILRAGDVVEAEQAADLDRRLRRRLTGEPVHRILGRRFFGEHAFRLSPETLEPRPDTETLVDLATEAFGRRKDKAFLFADVGTGSGAIAVSLLARFPQSLCVAVDLADGALRTARANAWDAGVGDRFLALGSDYLAALGRPFDALVSNPPYIPSGDLAALDAGVRLYDPPLALDGGRDGLDAYRRIITDAASLLKPDGDLLFEIGRGQEADVAALARVAGFPWVSGRRDLAGILRAVWFRRDKF